MNREPIKIHNSNFTQRIFPTAYCMPDDVRKLEADYAELEKRFEIKKDAQAALFLTVEALEAENKKIIAALKHTLDILIETETKNPTKVLKDEILYLFAVRSVISQDPIESRVDNIKSIDNQIAKLRKGHDD